MSRNSTRRRNAVAEPSDHELVASAWRVLHRARNPHTGKASAHYSSPFRAKYRGLCERCGRWIDRGDDVRFVKGFAGVVHSGCRPPAVTVTKRIEEVHAVASRHAPVVCAECNLEHNGECF